MYPSSLVCPWENSPPTSRRRGRSKGCLIKSLCVSRLTNQSAGNSVGYFWRLISRLFYSKCYNSGNNERIFKVKTSFKRASSPLYVDI